MTPITLVHSAEAAIANIPRFVEYVESGRRIEIRKTLSHARSWYMIEDGDSYLAAPSKFLGYADLTDDLYADETGVNGQLDGRVTERLLAPWTTQVEKDDPRYEKMRRALAKFCARYGAFPNKSARISVFQETEKPNVTEAELVKALTILIASLSSESKKNLKRLAFS